jgi:hypothetical protein
MLGAAVSRQHVLEPSHLRTQDELAVRENLIDGLIDLSTDTTALRLQIDEGKRSAGFRLRGGLTLQSPLIFIAHLCRSMVIPQLPGFHFRSLSTWRDRNTIGKQQRRQVIDLAALSGCGGRI